MGTLAQRSEPRFSAATSVVVAVEGRAALQDLWTANISKGGLFVVTRTPPPLQTRVVVTLETPDGTLQLAAEVVHVVPPQADSPTAVAGAGLQFSAVTEAQRQAIQRYVDGVAGTLSAPVDGAGGARVAELMTTVRALLAGLESGDVHAALQAPATATVEDLKKKLVTVTTALKDIPPEATVAQQTRIQSGQRAAEKLGHKVATLVPAATPAPAAHTAAVGSLDAEKRARMEAMAAAKAHADLGKAHMERQAFAAAEKDYALAVEKDPNVVAYQLALAWAIAVAPQRDLQTRVKLALEQLTPLMKRYRQAEIPYTAGMVLNAADRHQEAERYFKVALELDANHVASQRMLRLLEARRAKEAEAPKAGLFGLFKKS
jgi:uncharacterized protein (TIGR02266 family)